MLTIEQVSRWPLSPGKKYLLWHLSGKRITWLQSMRAKCADCMGGYVDGKKDCGMTDCPLYRWMPYREKKAK